MPLLYESYNIRLFKEDYNMLFMTGISSISAMGIQIKNLGGEEG